jgi:hypothetical protein
VVAKPPAFLGLALQRTVHLLNRNQVCPDQQVSKCHSQCDGVSSFAVVSQFGSVLKGTGFSPYMNQAK